MLARSEKGEIISQRLAQRRAAVEHAPVVAPGNGVMRRAAGRRAKRPRAEEWEKCSHLGDLPLDDNGVSEHLRLVRPGALVRDRELDLGSLLPRLDEPLRSSLAGPVGLLRVRALHKDEARRSRETRRARGGS